MISKTSPWTPVAPSPWQQTNLECWVSYWMCLNHRSHKLDHRFVRMNSLIHGTRYGSSCGLGKSHIWPFSKSEREDLLRALFWFQDSSAWKGLEESSSSLVQLHKGKDETRRSNMIVTVLHWLVVMAAVTSQHQPPLRCEDARVQKKLTCRLFLYCTVNLGQQYAFLTCWRERDFWSVHVFRLLAVKRSWTASNVQMLWMSSISWMLLSWFFF